MPELGPAQFGQMLPGREYVRQSDKDPASKIASEYGGVDAFVQPSPHDISYYPGEQLVQIYNTDPDDREGLSGNELDPMPQAVKPGAPSKTKAPQKSSLIREYTG